MKKIFYFLSLSVFLTGCGSPVLVKEIGRVNMISTRNIDSSADYKLLTTYSGGSEKELQKTESKTIEDAVSQTVKNVQGGEYMMNVRLYHVVKKDGDFFAAEGDVWGVERKGYRQFKVGDEVLYKDGRKYLRGKIEAYKDAQTVILRNAKDKMEEVDINNIFEVSSEPSSETEK